jgi:hypothetical protein
MLEHLVAKSAKDNGGFLRELSFDNIKPWPEKSLISHYCFDFYVLKVLGRDSSRKE